MHNFFVTIYLAISHFLRYALMHAETYIRGINVKLR